MTEPTLAEIERDLWAADADADERTADEEEADVQNWWAQLPDFIKPGYPLDLPPNRMPFAQFVFTEVGAQRFCPQAACRRARSCQGGEGPPCFRADRADLLQVLFLWWMMIYGNMPDDEYEKALRNRANRYALADEPNPPGPRTRSHRGRRRPMRQRRPA